MGKVLILSDIPLLTKREERDLIRYGIQITTLYRYSLYNEYLIKTGRMDYDIIVIDDSLRNVELFEICHIFHTSSKATIMLIGNMPSKEMWDKCKEIGFDRYYKKPIEPRELADHIKRAMDEKESKAVSALDELRAATATIGIPTDIELNVVKAKQPEPIPVMEKQLEPVAVRENRIEPVMVKENRFDPFPIKQNRFDPILTRETRVEPIRVRETRTEPMPMKENRIELKPVKENRIEPMPVIVKTSDITSSPNPGLKTTPDSNPNIWHDPKIANLINCFLKGKIKQLTPEINLGFGDGFSYREADSAMGTTGKETFMILENLAKQ
ncbi:MAG: response regulator, partial [Dehalococcoidales bacterium]